MPFRFLLPRRDGFPDGCVSTDAPTEAGLAPLSGSSTSCSNAARAIPVDLRLLQALSIFVGWIVTADCAITKFFLRITPIWSNSRHKPHRTATLEPTYLYHELYGISDVSPENAGDAGIIHFFPNQHFADAYLLFISPPTSSGRYRSATFRLGNRLTVDPRTLTPLVLVRIQVPQPK